MKLYSPATVKEIQARHGFRTAKSLGQNFLVDRTVIEKIIESADIGPRDLVLEIGPGMGVLTSAAAEKAGKVLAVEIDKNLLPILAETLADYENVEVINADVLKLDLCKVLAEARLADGEKPAAVKVLGNLPYYITTPIVMKLLEDGVPCESITVMMQKEVAERIASEPGSKVYGAISVVVQYYCTVEPVCAVPKSCFVPQPQVDSEVIRLDVREQRPVELLDEKAFFDCVKAGFGQRRKTLLNSLSGVLGLSKESVKEMLDAAGIDGGRRAETLSLEEFANVANEFAKRKNI